ncbi:ATP-binding protein [Salinibacterium sp. NSLL150]|uniref:AAA family ATPase n=1 Tax=unclassified Salinibacterium TaxID=2632331 RepID=UPI0018CE6743|nr:MULTISPECIES: ATP-binding protein [unclassified Salinibacterium]MBH0025212.1 ATP-binding protein [Salinibacterium sp. SWN248]MBH0100185.1 ATP-binding protein [Salinibacterium sp. NSLL35]MBH0102939.1 ATP-binding protein [Salinibacterium sp. NSLL150]MBH0105699.1 ATP-binding protein [Salinibacterium sp. NSLL16]MBH0108459.1 ATP-binding protein [Salinibacterium sp. NSLL17]
MLIAMAGLPGAGKTTIAEVVGARRKTTVLSVDQIETAILKAGISAGQPIGLAAYLVAEALAESVLLNDDDIIIDAVNAVDPAREQWVSLAERTGSGIRFIEVVCSDEAVHEQRLVERAAKRALAGAPDRDAVEQSVEEYSPWGGVSGAVARITLDSAGPIGVNVERASAFLDA